MNISATEMPNFIRNFHLLHELLIFEYWGQNISVSNIALHTAVRHSGVNKWRETVHMLTHETPDFITPALWLANSPDLTPSTTRFGGSCRSVCTAARFVMSTSWSRAWSKSGNISTRWSSMKQSGNGDHVFELAFEHTWTFWTQNFRCGDSLCRCRISLKSDVVSQSYGNVYKGTVFLWTPCIFTWWLYQRVNQSGYIGVEQCTQD